MDFSEVEDLGFEEFITSVLNRTEEVFERIVRNDDEEHRSSLHSHIDCLKERQYYLSMPVITCGYK